MRPGRVFVYLVSTLPCGTVIYSQTSTPTVVPAGTQITIRTIDAIQSKNAEAGQSYRCSVDSPVMAGTRQLVAKGADCVLRIVEMKSAGKLRGNNELELTLSELRAGEELVSVNSQPTAIAGKSKGKSTATRTGIGAAAGAGLGAVLGGGKGAAIGSGVGRGQALPPLRSHTVRKSKLRPRLS